MDRADVPAVGTTIMCGIKLGTGTKGDSAPCPVPQEVERIEIQGVSCGAQSNLLRMITSHRWRTQGYHTGAVTEARETAGTLVVRTPLFSVLQGEGLLFLGVGEAL